MLHKLIFNFYYKELKKGKLEEKMFAIKIFFDVKLINIFKNSHHRQKRRKNKDWKGIKAKQNAFEQTLKRKEISKEKFSSKGHSERVWV